MSVRALLDTSALLPLLVKSHPHHEAARAYRQSLVARQGQMLVAAHGLAETYSGLTRLPGRLAPTDAARIIDLLLEQVEVVALSGEEYAQVVRRVAGLGLVSGAIYDLIHVRSAEVGRADELVTFNGRDFRRMEPQGGCRLVVLTAV